MQASDLLLDEQQVLAIDKPPGMPVQATMDAGLTPVLPALADLLKRLGKPRRQLWLVHRLDKETSGVLLVAASRERAAFLAQEFRARRVAKVYLAICYGRPTVDEFSVDARLAKIDPVTGKVYPRHRGGQPAHTKVRLLQHHPALGVSLLACYPTTGRTHQIRVHLLLSGLPLVGDKRYQSAESPILPQALQDLTQQHHFLHARSLQFTPRLGSGLTLLQAPPPPSFAAFCAAVGWPLALTATPESLTD